MMFRFMRMEQVATAQVLTCHRIPETLGDDKKEAPRGGALQAIGKNLIMLGIGLAGCGFTIKTAKAPRRFRCAPFLFIPDSSC